MLGLGLESCQQKRLQTFNGDTGQPHEAEVASSDEDVKRAKHVMSNAMDNGRASPVSNQRPWTRPGWTSIKIGVIIYLKPVF